VVNQDSSLSINAVEACAVENLDVEAAKGLLAETQKKLEATGIKEEEKGILKAEMEVYDAVSKIK
jgi:hypothetical protein